MNSIKEIFSKSFERENDLVFVLMPFSEALNEIYELVIKPSIVEEPILMRCIRADEVFSDKPIIGDIWGLIQKAEIIIADLTSKNPNVLYELGLSHALWKKVILIAQSVDDLPFDLRHFRAIIYKHSIKGTQNLRVKLSAALASLRAIPYDESSTLSKDFRMNSLLEFKNISIINKSGFDSGTSFINTVGNTQKIIYPKLVVSVTTMKVFKTGIANLSVLFDLGDRSTSQSLELNMRPSEAYAIKSGLNEDSLFTLILSATDYLSKTVLIEVRPILPKRRNQKFDGV